MVLSRHERSPAENSCSTGKGLDIGSNSRRAGGHQECSREVERWRPNALESQVNPGAPGSIAPTTTYSKETALQQPSLMRHRIMPPQRKREALTVTRLIHEVLVGQLSIPLRQIVNDTTFQKYTGSKRPDLLISEFDYDGSNDDQFIRNVVAYAEVKDDCSVGDADWQDAMKQAEGKAPNLGLPYFIVTNCQTSVFYNASTMQEIMLNRNPIREFQTIDILRLIKNRLTKDSSGPHHQDSGEAKIRESTAGVSRKPSSDCKACGCSSKHLCGLTAWNT